MPDPERGEEGDEHAGERRGARGCEVRARERPEHRDEERAPGPPEPPAGRSSLTPRRSRQARALEVCDERAQRGSVDREITRTGRRAHAELTITRDEDEHVLGGRVDATIHAMGGDEVPGERARHATAPIDHGQPPLVPPERRLHGREQLIDAEQEQAEPEQRDEPGGGPREDLFDTEREHGHQRQLEEEEHGEDVGHPDPQQGTLVEPARASHAHEATRGGTRREAAGPTRVNSR